MLFCINSLELILVYDVLAFASSSAKVLFSASSPSPLPLKDEKGYTEKLSFVWRSQVAQSESSMKSTRKYRVIKASSLSLCLWISWVCALLCKLWLKGSLCWLGNPLLGWTPRLSEVSMNSDPPWLFLNHFSCLLPQPPPLSTRDFLYFPFFFI